MSFGGAWFFDDILDDLLYPQSKWDSIKFGLMSLLVWLIIFPLTLIICFFIGFFDVCKKRKCDACGKYELNNVRSSSKFYWFCKKCNEEYSNVESKFISNKGASKNKKKVNK